MGQVIQLIAGASGGAQSGLASFDVPTDGFITGVEWSISAFLDTTQQSSNWQLSFSNTLNNQNDARNVISNVSTGQAFISAPPGSVVAGYSGYTHLPDLPVAAGERVFLHASNAVGAESTCTCCVHLSTNQSRPSVRR